MAGEKDPKVAYIADVGGHHVSLDMPRHPPRLSVAVLWAKPGERSMWQTSLDRQLASAESTADREKLLVDLDKPGAFDTELNRLLLHIVERLENGLDEAWMSRYGYAAPTWSKRDSETHQEHADRLSDAIDQARGLLELYNQPEEQWARAFTEMCIYAPYLGPGQLLFGNGMRDRDIYAQWPKVYSIGMACQHLSSYGALSRGLPASDLDNGMTAGPNGFVKLFHAPADKDKAKSSTAEGEPKSSATADGKPKRPQWVPDKLGDYKNQDLRPGDIASGSENTSQTGFAHCASTLRRWPLGKPAESAASSAAKLQLIDTGVMADVGDTSTQDHDWLRDGGLPGPFYKAKAGLQGLGRLPMPTDLAGAVTSAKKALPMGFARLILCEKGGRVRYVSALLPMWFGEHRFAISRYIWSIRNLPARQTLVAYWALYAPIGDSLFQQVVAESASPSRTASDIFNAAKSARMKLVAVCTSEPRVVRAILKMSEDWREAKPGQEDASTQTSPSPVAKQLPLVLDESRKGSAAWGVLEVLEKLATEYTLADATAKKPDEKAMADRGVRYFNGTSKPEK